MNDMYKYESLSKKTDHFCRLVLLICNVEYQLIALGAEQ